MDSFDDDEDEVGGQEEISYGIIQYFGLSKDPCHCGYCKSIRNPGNTYGLWANSLPTVVYQGLIDRNWRRCGKYVYKPVNQEICCPMYTIRCNALNFRLSKSQKKVIKKFNNFIKHDFKRKQCSSKMQPIVADIHMEQNDLKVISNKKSALKIDGNEKIQNMMKDLAPKNEIQSPEMSIKTEAKNIDKSSSGDRSFSLKSSKRKFQRRQKLIAKTMKRNGCSESEAKQILFNRSQAKQKTKTLEDFLSEIDNYPGAKHTFKTKMIKVESKLSDPSDQSDYDVFKKYQMTIHNEHENEISYRSYKRFLLDSPLYYTLMRPEFSFLNKTDCDLPRQYGAYHQHYYIDDRLVAVGVIDILPNCISSVYLYYDPEYNFLDLGVYSALREIMLVRKLNKMMADLKYYYLGYYIHQCPKMRYKSKYHPSELLCSETYRWFPIEKCLEKLNKSKYARFCDDSTVADEEGYRTEDCDIKVLYNQAAFTYRDFKRYARNQAKEHEEKIYEYARLVGKRCASLLFYYVDTD